MKKQSLVTEAQRRKTQMLLGGAIKNARQYAALLDSTIKRDVEKRMAIRMVKKHRRAFELLSRR